MPFWTVFAIVLSAVSFTASYVQAKKAQKRAKRLQDEMAGVLVNKESNIEAIPVVYGERRVGGVRVYMTTSGDDRHEYLYVALVVSEGRVESISDLEIDEVPATDDRFIGLVSYNYQLGDDDQTVNTILDDSLITVDDQDPNWEYQGVVVTNQAFVNNFRLRGVAYVAIRLKYDAEVFAGVPDFTVKVKGRRVYDPRKDSTSTHYKSSLGVSDHRANDDSTWDWTDNPALCLRDYLTNDRFGKGLDASDIDDTEFMQAANDIDSFTVTPYSGGPTDHKLFSLNAVIDTNEQIFTNVEKILLSCRGFLPYTFGKYGLKVDQAGTSVMTLGTDKIIGDISIVGSRKEDRFNQVIVKFPDANTRFQPNNVAWPDQSSSNPTGVSDGNGGYLTEAELHAQFLTEDGELLVDEIDLEHCTDIYQARDLARIFLWRSRNALNVALQATSEAMELTVGDVVSITHPTPNWTAKKFQVDEMGINYDGTVTLKCVEYDATIYAYDSAVEQEDLTDIIRGDPGNVQAPTNVTGTNTGSALLDDGTFHAVLNVSWTASQDATVIEYEVRYKLSSETPYKYLKTTDTTVRIEGMAPGTYNIGVRALDAFGGKSAFTDGSNVNTGIDTTIPGDITNTSVTAGIGNLVASWDNPDDDDLKQIRVYVATTNTKPTDPTAVVTGEAYSVTNVVGATDAARTRYFWLEAEDYSGNVGNTTASFNGIANQATGDDIGTGEVGTGNIEDDAVTIDKIANTLQSTNYVAATSGWKLTTDGTFEAGDGTFRGSVTSTSGTIGGFTLGSTSLTAGSGSNALALHTVKGIYLGSTTFSSAPFRVNTAGDLTATSATLTDGTLQGGSIQSNNTDPIPTDVFTRSSNQNIPTGDESGAFMDLASGSFLFGDADSFVSFAENSDGTAFELDIKGVLAPTTLDFSAVTDTTVMPSNIKAQGYVDASIGVDAISSAVWNEIDSRVGQGSGGFYASATGNYLGTSSQYITLASTPDHGVEDITIKVVVSDTFAYPINYTYGSTATQINVSLFYKPSTDSDWTNEVQAGTTQTFQANPTLLQYATRYTIDANYSVTLTSGSGGDIADNTDYDFRVKIARVTSPTVFMQGGSGGANDSTGTPIVLEVSENASGITATGGNADTLDNIDSTGFLRLGTSGSTVDNTAYGDQTFTGDVTITGTLNLQGSIDQYNVTDLDVSDKTITVNSGNTQALSNGAGLIVDRGTAADASITWDETDDQFDISHNVKIAGAIGVTNIVTNKVVKFAGTFLDDSNITDTGSLITLGSATTISGQLTASNNILLTGDLKMTGSDSFIWSPNNSTGYTGFYDPHNGDAAFKWKNDVRGWGIFGEPESGYKLKVHGDTRTTGAAIFGEQISIGTTDTGTGNIVDARENRDGNSLMRLWNTSQTSSAVSAIRAASSGTGAEARRFELTDQTGYLTTLAADNTNGFRVRHGASNSGGPLSNAVRFGILNSGDAYFTEQLRVRSTTYTPFSSLFAGTLVIEGASNEDPIITKTHSGTTGAAAAVFHQTSTSPSFAAVLMNASATSGTNKILQINSGVSASTGVGGTQKFAVDLDGRTWSRNTVVVGDVTSVNSGFVGADETDAFVLADGTKERQYLLTDSNAGNAWHQWVRYRNGQNTWRIGTLDAGYRTGASFWRLAGTNMAGSEVNYIVAGPRAGNSSGTGWSNRTVIYEPYARYGSDTDYTGSGTLSKILSTNTTGESAITLEYTSGAMDINLKGNPPELNFEDTSSTSGTKRARWTLDSNTFSAQALNDADSAVTHQLLQFTLSNGNAAFSGAISSGNLSAGNSANVSMDASANGQIEIKGYGYQGAIALDGTAMHIYHNSSGRSLILGTNETARMTISGTGVFDFHGRTLNNIGEATLNSSLKLRVSASDTAHQRVDARDDATNFSRAHWYGVRDNGTTSNFRHAWYDGSNYINVTAASGTITFGGAITSSGSLKSTNATGLILDTGAAYRDVKFELTGNTGNGTLEVIPMTIPGSGTASYTTHFKSAVGGGTTRHDLEVDGNITSSGNIVSNNSNVGRLYLGNTSASYYAGAIIAQRSSYAPTGKLSFQVPTHGVGTDYGLTEQMSITVSAADTKDATIVMLPHGGKVGMGITPTSYRLHIESETDKSIKVTRGSGTQFRMFHTGDGQTHMGSSGTNANLIFRTGTTVGSDSERLRITKDGLVKQTFAGNVNDGSYYSGYTMNITGTSTFGGMRFDRNGTAMYRVGMRSDNKFQIANFNLSSGVDDQFVIDTSGKVGISTAPSFKFHVSSTDQNVAVFDSSNNNGTYIWIRNSDAVTGRQANLGFAPANNIEGARISAIAQEDFSQSANRTADLAFWTRLNGTMEEHLRITSQGTVGIGTNTNLGNGTLNVESNGTSVLQARANTAGSVDGDTTVVVSRAVNSTAGKWAHAIYRGYTHAWSYGGNAASNEAMRVSSTGRVRINNSVGSAWDSLGTLLVRQVADGVGIGVVDNGSTNTFMMRNNGTYAEMHYNGNLPILFSQSGGERVRIHNSGGDAQLALGTTSPQTVGSGYGAFTVGGSTGGGIIFASTGSGFAGTWANTNGYVMSAFGARHIDMKTNDASRLYIASGGNIGLNTTAPDVLTHIYKGSSGKSWAADSGDALVLENSDSVALDIRTPSGNQGLILFSDNNARARGVMGYYHAGEYMYFSTGASQRMTIHANGRITMGSASISTAGLDAGDLRVTSKVDINNTSTAAFRIYNGSTFRGGLGTGQWASGNTSYVDRIALYSQNGFQFYCGGGSTPQTALNNAGSLGIKQLTPTETLHIGSGQSNYIRIHNAASGDVASGITITRGNSTGLAIYDNPQDATSTFNAADHINFRTGNSSYRLNIRNNGKIGINESTPNGYLHVTGKASYTTATSAEVSGLEFVRLQPNSNSEHSLWFHNAGNNLGISGYSNAATTSVRDITMQTYGGKVGIGVASPTYMLDVKGPATEAEPYAIIRAQAVDNYGGFLADAPTQSHIRFAVNGNMKWQWRTGSNVSGQLRAYSWDGSGDKFSLSTDGTAAFAAAELSSTTPVVCTTSSTALFDHTTNSTPVAFRMNKGGNWNSTSRSFGVLNLSRTNGTTANGNGSSLFFMLKKDGGALAEYAGITGVRETNTTGSLDFHSYQRNVQMRMDNSGNLTCAGNVTAYSDPSDRKLKDDIENIPDALAKVQTLNGVTFTYKKDGKRSTGLIAQDVQAVLPEAVYDAKDFDGNEFLALNYGNTVGLLVEAIKEQQQQIDALKQTIEDMKNGDNQD